MSLDALVVWLLVLLWEATGVLLLEHLVACVDAVHDHSLQLDEVSIKSRLLRGTQISRLNMRVICLAGNLFLTSDVTCAIGQIVSILESLPSASFLEFALLLLSDLIYQVMYSKRDLTLVIECSGFCAWKTITFEAIQSSE